MKIIIFLLLVSISITTFSQQLKYEDLKSDTLVGPFTSYISKGGIIFKVGEKLKIGLPSSEKDFLYLTKKVQHGLPADLMMEVFLKRRKLPDPVDEPLWYDVSNSESEINSIIISGTKKTGFYALIKSEGKNMSGKIEPSAYTIKIENAIEVGEIRTSLISSDQAISELKKAKYKLDLDLITKVKYDSIKTELAKYIK